ncbi:MAG: redox-sensing transcriptional repressor Rex [Fibrobacterota bacterium]
MGRNDRGVPVPTVKRLPLYLTVLQKLQAEQGVWVSATTIARRLGLTPIQVRKDMAYTDIVGLPKKGYPIEELIRQIRIFLGWNRCREAFLVGVGALGTALLGYDGFADKGLTILAGFDSNEEKVGRHIHGKEIFSVSRFHELVQRCSVSLGVLTVPPHAAQEIADIMVDSGIRGIWNFSSLKLNVPQNVIVQDEDISAGLAVLSIGLSQ